MNYHTSFLQNIGKMSQNLSAAAVVIGALRVKAFNLNGLLNPWQLDKVISNFRVVGTYFSVLFKFL